MNRIERFSSGETKQERAIHKKFKCYGRLKSLAPAKNDFEHLLTQVCECVAFVAIVVVMKKIAYGLMIVLVLAVAMFPVYSRCGGRRQACASPPRFAGDTPHYYYEIEPLIIYAVEEVTPVDLPVYYVAGEE